MTIVLSNKTVMLYELFVEIYYTRKDIMTGAILSLGHCTSTGMNAYYTYF